MEAVRPKTRDEIAHDLLKKYGFCTIHLIELIEEPNTISVSYINQYKFCPKCREESNAQWQMEETKRKAIKGIEIKYALEVLKGKDAPSS
jgi:hypothetical protein